MSDEEEFEYSNLSADELREVAPRIEHCGDAELQWRVMVEVARRESAERKPHRFRNFGQWLFDNERAPRNYRWLFEHGEERTTDAILLWWEDRRPFWKRFVGLVSSCGLLSFLAFLLLSGIDAGPFAMGSWLETVLVVMVGWGWISGALFMLFALLASFVYFGFVGLDMMLSAIVYFTDWRWSVFLFSSLLALALIIAAFSWLSLLYSLATR